VRLLNHPPQLEKTVVCGWFGSAGGRPGQGKRRAGGDLGRQGSAEEVWIGTGAGRRFRKEEDGRCDGERIPLGLDSGDIRIEPERC
jgi:hypothetical protein